MRSYSPCNTHMQVLTRKLKNFEELEKIVKKCFGFLNATYPYLSKSPKFICDKFLQGFILYGFGIVVILISIFQNFCLRLNKDSYSVFLISLAWEAFRCLKIFHENRETYN